MRALLLLLFSWPTNAFFLVFLIQFIVHFSKMTWPEVVASFVPSWIDSLCLHGNANTKLKVQTMFFSCSTK